MPGSLNTSLFMDYDDIVIRSISQAYPHGDVENILSSLTKPPSRLYVRVNTLKVSVEKAVELIEEEGYRVYRDEHIPEALYFIVEGPNNIADIGKKVVADKYASESVMMGSNLYSPGVVKCDRDILEGDHVSVYSPNGILIAVGVAARSCRDAMETKKGLFVKVSESLYTAPPVRELEVWKNGYIYPQSLPSMIVSRLAKAEPGWTVVDMCSAPGGKASHIYQLTLGRASIYAFEHSSSRLERMKHTLSRLGIDGIKIFKADSRYLSRDYPWLKADLVILDPPCTATGVRPKIYDRKTSKDLYSLANYQRQFIYEAHRILRDNGLLVYSTCSITFHENEAHIIDVVEEGYFEPVKPDADLGGVAFIGRDLPWVRFDPYIHDTPGFFIAVLRKV